MSHPSRRTLPSLFLAAALFGGAGLAFVAPSVARAEDGEACSKKPADYKTKRVGDACKSGGRKAVADLMKAVVKAGKKDDDGLKCKSCHSDMKTYALSDEAQAQKKLADLLKLVP